jgi:hypothetical protein
MNGMLASSPGDWRKQIGFRHKTVRRRAQKSGAGLFEVDFF